MRPVRLLPFVIALANPASAQTTSARAVTDPPVRAASPSRKEFVERTRIQVRSIVTANNKQVTDEERLAIRAHWRRVMRLLRVREVAEQQGDLESVKQAEVLLEAFGRRFYEELRTLQTTAPAKSGQKGEPPKPVNSSSGIGGSL